MATNTTNYGLVKPAYTDTADIADINGNMDKVDTALQALGKGIAIISNNNTHVAIASGQYVYIHSHGTLAEGLYIADSNISQNATLSSSNVHAVASSGAMNDLKSSINTLNSKLTTKSYSMINIPSGVTLQNASIRGCANIVCGYIQISKEVSIGGNIGSLSSSDIYPTTTYYFPCFSPNTSKYYGIITINPSGEVRYYPNSDAAGTGTASIGANINYII